DLRGDRLGVGEPTIFHHKEGSFQRNIQQEHLAHLVSDEFVLLLRSVSAQIQPATYLDMMSQLVEELSASQASCSVILRSYFTAVLPAMKAWVGALGQ